MRQFIHMEASTVQEASKNAAKGNVMVIAGGTDLLGTRR